MDIKHVGLGFSVSGQLSTEDIGHLADMGYRAIVNNRPDQEAVGQPTSEALQAASESHGLKYIPIPITPNEFPVDAVEQLRNFLAATEGEVLAFCRTGNRSSKLYELVASSPVEVGATESGTNQHVQVLIVGGGAAGIATSASILKRDRRLQISIVEPHDEHYYQPGWTMVGGGVFDRRATVRRMSDVMPNGVDWIQSSVTEFLPEADEVKLVNGAVIKYDRLVVCPGIKLDWNRIEGLAETLGKNGVTSNYHYQHAPYTWSLVQGLKKGKAIFTQPPMPIKCAGAPQKALYLSADYWLKESCLDNVDIHFYNAGAVLFGVSDYVPALQQYMDKYGVNLHFEKNLVAVDGANQIATFETADGARTTESFEFLHVSPPQTAPDFIRTSSLANAAGWVDVDENSLQHKRFKNIFSLGDVCSTPNAKTAAAVRKQAPVVAHNLLESLNEGQTVARYDGYGSCPLTVERGKVVLAEFGYGGKLLPSVPKWMLNGKMPTRLAWLLKAVLLPPIYFQLMCKGREWLANPEVGSVESLETVEVMK